MTRNDATRATDSFEPQKSLPPPANVKQGLIAQALCHEMQLRDIFWHPVQLSLREMFGLLRNRQTLATVAAVAFAMMLADPPGFRGMIPAWQIAVIWYGGATIVILLKHVFSFLATLFQMRNPAFQVYLPVLSCMEYGIAFWISEYAATALSGESYHGVLLHRFPQYMGAFLVVEYFVVGYIIPPLRLAPEKSEPTALPTPALPEPAVPVARLDIGGRSLRLDRIQHIASEEHYLRVTLPYETLLVRGKLAQVLQSVPPEAGIQPHRSWWVSRGMQPVMRRLSAAKSELELADGSRVPVARARVKEVQDWIDLHADW